MADVAGAVGQGCTATLYTLTMQGCVMVLLMAASCGARQQQRVQALQQYCWL